MAYTAIIDETTPAGGDNAALTDDQLRALKLAIKERLNSLFADFNADPLVLKDNAPLFNNNVYVKAGVTAFALKMAQGLVLDTSILTVDKTAGLVPRLLLGYAGGGSNWAWTVIPNAPAANMPVWESSLNGLIAVDTSTSQLVFYANGLRFKVLGSSTF